MSLIHSTIVGHFDPCTLSAQDRQTIRPLDIDAATALLSKFPDHVASRIEFHDGYVECWWADRSMQVSNAVRDYAYRLAELQDCIAAETPVCYVTYPAHAKQLQADAWKRWREQNPDPERPPPAPPIFDPPKPGPCPYCGEQLRTAIARQCRHCKMDWHDPQNVYHRTTNCG